jgi:CTP:molybdopterin cytidylyltransferase MocA
MADVRIVVIELMDHGLCHSIAAAAAAAAAAVAVVHLPGWPGC